MMPINLAEIGSPQIIRRIGGNPEVKKHLEDLGFHVGGEVTVVNVFSGNLIIKVKDSRVALNRELAGKIMICKEVFRYDNMAWRKPWNDRSSSDSCRDRHNDHCEHDKTQEEGKPFFLRMRLQPLLHVRNMPAFPY